MFLQNCIKGHRRSKVGARGNATVFANRPEQEKSRRGRIDNLDVCVISQLVFQPQKDINISCSITFTSAKSINVHSILVH